MQDISFSNIFQFLKNPGDSLSSKIIHGSIWTFATQIFTRALTFTRTIILARLLSPNDFGLMGIAFLALSTLQTFSETGVNAALIYKKENTKEELDVAWTIRFLRSLLIGSILFLSAPYIASFFKNEQATSIIRFIALGQVFYGLSNIAIIRFQKEIEFHKYFLFSICSTIPEVIIAIWAAIVFKSVWALVIGYLAGAIANCIFSYVFCPFKPRFSLSGIHVRGLLGYGKWIWASTIIIFLITQGDDIFVGKFLGAAALGLYQLAYRISNLPATEISHVIARIAFPAYVKVRDDVEKLGRLYWNFFENVFLFSLYTVVLILLFSEHFVLTFLGSKWKPMISSLKVLAIYGGIRSIGATNGTFYNAIGKPHLDTLIAFFQLLLLVILLSLLGIKYNILGVSLSTTISIFCVHFFAFFYIIKFVGFNYHSFKRILLNVLFLLVFLFLFYFLNLFKFFGFFENLILYFMSVFSIYFLSKKISKL